jgi:drug/metabolite transporter (DMT)-like permease
MRWVLMAVLACVAVLAQFNMKVTSPLLPTSYQQAADLGFFRAVLLVMRVGFTSGMSLLLTWYTYKYFGFLELLVASSLTYVLGVFVARFFFAEPITWARIGGVILVTGGVSLFFVK